MIINWNKSYFIIIFKIFKW